MMYLFENMGSFYSKISSVIQALLSFHHLERILEIISLLLPVNTVLLEFLPFA